MLIPTIAGAPLVVMPFIFSHFKLFFSATLSTAKRNMRSFGCAWKCFKAGKLLTHLKVLADPLQKHQQLRRVIDICTLVAGNGEDLPAFATICSWTFWAISSMRRVTVFRDRLIWEKPRVWFGQTVSAATVRHCFTKSPHKRARPLFTINVLIR